MGKFSKFKDILKIGTAVAKPFAPGAVGTALSAVNAALADAPGSTNAEEALKTLAKDNDEQTEAILALLAHVKKQDDRIAKLEARG